MEVINTNTGETVSATAVSSPTDWKARALAAEKRLESMELVVVCATDIVEAWPKLTLRGLGTMTKSIDTLRQALESMFAVTK